jgi:Zn-dependent metalloprotease
VGEGWADLVEGNKKRSGTAKMLFPQFADITVDFAKQIFGDDAAKTVRQAWNDVGVRGDK